MAVSSVAMTGMTSDIGLGAQTSGMRKIVHQSDITRMSVQTNSFRLGAVWQKANGSGAATETPVSK